MSWPFCAKLRATLGCSQTRGASGMWTKAAGRFLFAAAALAAGTPVPAHVGRMAWVEICDALHSHRKVPIPLDKDDRSPGQACHAGCSVIPNRSGAGRTKT